MKLLPTLLLVALCICPTFAQTPAKLTVKGDLNIRFNTRTQTNSDGKPRAGVEDVYSLNLNVADSAIFKGTISYRPTIPGSVYGVKQSAQLTFALDTDVVNPANLAQTRNVGKLSGIVPIDEKNAYHFSNGNAAITVFGAGTAKGFESKFSGLALGKPPAAKGVAKLQQDVLRVVNGKGAVSVTKYDKMEFQQHIIAAGPVQIYPEATVNGVMVYDYARTAWYFQGLSVSYAADGKAMRDTITGNIRWVESPNRKTTGQGMYQFDVRVNEPPPSEAAVFAGSTDESAFFATDDVTPALTGTMNYKDTLVGEDVTASTVQIALSANKLTKQQVMYLCKLLLLSSVVPINSD
jgi:hypothetical protein